MSSCSLYFLCLWIPGRAGLRIEGWLGQYFCSLHETPSTMGLFVSLIWDYLCYQRYQDQVIAVHDSHTPKLRWVKATSDFPDIIKNLTNFNRSMQCALIHLCYVCQWHYLSEGSSTGGHQSLVIHFFCLTRCRLYFIAVLCHLQYIISFLYYWHGIVGCVQV